MGTARAAAGEDSEMKALIEFQQVCKYYHMGDSTVTAADHISFQISKGEFVAIVGSSGSGKSTCMNIIGCLDVPSEGIYLLDGRDVGQMNKNKLAERAGFEPAVAFTTPVFETSTFDHSDTSPKNFACSQSLTY